MPIQQWSEGIWLVTLADEPALSEDLLSALDRARNSAATPDIVLDMAGVRQLNSSNLSQLLRLRKLAIDQDSHLRIAAPQDNVWAIFLTTGLDKVFEFSPDVSTALADLKMRK